jgi:hypothetical protein
VNFPFNQEPKTKDCGYRCVYYVLNLAQPYESWLENFRFFRPAQSGIYFSDICDILTHYGRDFRFTELSETGLYIIYSGVWLHPEGKKHGHYFVYHDGVVYCSTRREPYRMSLAEVTKRLEAKTVDHAYRCLRLV